jgi:serine/threonine protein kinase
MFESNKPDAEINLIDFGLSKKYGPNEKYMREGVGTIYTMAPQVLQGVYTSKADLWSIGVISFMLLSSEKPFYSRKRYAR